MCGLVLRGKSVGNCTHARRDQLRPLASLRPAAALSELLAQRVAIADPLSLSEKNRPRRGDLFLRACAHIVPEDDHD